MAAKYEFEENESIESARNLFQRALRFIPSSTKLWLEVDYLSDFIEIINLLLFSFWIYLYF
jgi:hypothetical protein